MPVHYKPNSFSLIRSNCVPKKIALTRQILSSLFLQVLGMKIFVFDGLKVTPYKLGWTLNVTTAELARSFKSSIFCEDSSIEKFNNNHSALFELTVKEHDTISYIEASFDSFIKWKKRYINMI